MTFDGWLRRHYPWIVGVFLATTAWFQANAATTLARTRLAPHGGVLPPSLTPVDSALGVERITAGGVSPVLTRNPFDSTVGAMTVTEQRSPEPVAAAATRADPLLDPSCDFGWVVLIAVADPWPLSLAVIREKAGRSELRRVGDELGTHTLRYVTPHRVWFQTGESRCQMRLGDAPVQPAPPPVRQNRATGRSARARRRAARAAEH